MYNKLTFKIYHIILFQRAEYLKNNNERLALLLFVYLTTLSFIWETIFLISIKTLPSPGVIRTLF